MVAEGDLGDMEMTDGMEMRTNDRLSWERTSNGLLLVPEDQRKLILEEHHDAIS